MATPEMPGDTVDQALRERFESAWRAGRPEPIERFLPSEEDADYLAALEQLVQIEVGLAWESWRKAAQRPSTAAQEQTVARPAQVETYLARFPRLKQPEIMVRLLRQEHSSRKQCGEAVSIEEYRQRFPQLAIADEQFESGLPMVSQSSMDVKLAETLPTGLPGGSTATAVAPQEFGNYESLEEIGRGGMGVVYRARQRTADRIVALKVIRRDRLESLPRETHTSALDRFRHEAQAAARLEHDNIVTVYEVGEVDDQPFFSMRYVEGRSLSEILRDGPMDNRRAAAYLEPVARAVHEAHRQGILHRDLKPQNILVDKKTDRALVADFGLAKLSEGNEELTRAGEVMGTPSYMSPEQAKDSARVAAETDVYALGATLYHVLTGRPPFQAATPVETLRQVIDEEPAPPRQLNPSIDRDLETICLKCLQKEPLRRYHSAEALADDLRRYLAGEPILARPIGTLGRIWRWCRRKPAMATAVGLAATFFVLAFVGTGIGYLRASAARTQAEESFSQAQAAVDDFLTLVGEETLLNEPGMQPLRRKLLAKARDYYQQFLSQRGDDPTIRDAVALAHFRVGVVTDKIDSPQEAMASYLLARDIQKQLVSERPGDPDSLMNLGNTWTAIGAALSRQRKLNEARKAHLEAITVRQQLAQRAGRNETEFPRTLANSYMNLGIIEMDLGIGELGSGRLEEVRHQFDEAHRQLEKAQTLRKELLARAGKFPKARRDLGKGYFNLGNLAMVDGDVPLAEEYFTDAIKVFTELLEEDRKVLANQSDLASCYRRLGDLHSYHGDPDSARGWYQKALERMATLARTNPAVPSYQAALAGLHMNLGLLESEQARSQEALEAFQQARDILQPLVDGYPEVGQYRRDFGVTLREIACLQSEAGEYETARGNFETAKTHFSKLVEKSRGKGRYKTELDFTMAGSCINQGRRQSQEAQPDSALASLGQALQILHELAVTYPTVTRYPRDFAVTMREIAALLSETGDDQGAREHLEAAQKYLSMLVKNCPWNVDYRNQLEKAESALGALPAAQPQDE